VAFETLPPRERLTAEDRWILHRLSKTAGTMNGALNAFRFNEACHCIYDFTWHDFCDWYVEAIKRDLYRDDEQQRRSDAQNVCTYVLASILKMLHPIMPFITEEIWHAIRETVDYPEVIDGESIFSASYPSAYTEYEDNEIDRNFALLQQIIIALRTIRAENNVPPDKTGTAAIVPVTEEQTEWLRSQTTLINMFARLSNTRIGTDLTPPSFAGRSIVHGNQIYLELEGLIDRQVEQERLAKEISRIEGLIAAADKRLNNGQFIAKAPPAVVQKEKEKYQALQDNLEKLNTNLAVLEQ
jgi:valyl-tRNA synthetase